MAQNSKQSPSAVVD